jgi:hypothetical protein
VAGFKIHGGERDLLGTCAGDRHRLRDNVNGRVLQRTNAIPRCQQMELHLGGIAEEVAGDLARDVHVEALQFAGEGVTEAEQVRALIDADYQPTAPPNLLDRLTRRGGRAQTSRGITTFDGCTNNFGRDGRAAGHRQCSERGRHLSQRLHSGTPGEQGRGEGEDCCGGAHQ